MCLYIIEEALIPILVEMLFVKVHKVCQACISCIGDYDV
jgi:hypothetical protein